MKEDKERAMHTAITELVLYLKGDGTVSSVQKMTGIHRNMLTAIFEVYDAQRRGEVIQTKSVSKPRIKNLYWGTNSLITVANTLGIPLSELIRAAEDVLDGLPPWFQRRISRDTVPRSNDELVHVFLEALSCFTYADPFPTAEPAKKARQYRKRNVPETAASICKARIFSEEDVSNLTFYVDCLLDLSALKDFVEAYRAGAISSKDAFCALKKAVDEVKKGAQGDLPMHLFERLRTGRTEFVAAINKDYRLFIGSRKSDGDLASTRT